MITWKILWVKDNCAEIGKMRGYCFDEMFG